MIIIKTITHILKCYKSYSCISYILVTSDIFLKTLKETEVLILVCNFAHSLWPMNLTVPVPYFFLTSSRRFSKYDFTFPSPICDYFGLHYS